MVTRSARTHYPFLIAVAAFATGMSGFPLGAQAQVVAFGDRQTLIASSSLASLSYAKGDIDNDGKLDVVTQSSSVDGMPVVIRSINTNERVIQVQSHLGTEEFGFLAMTLVDLDGDGDLDLVTAGPNGNEHSVNNIYYWSGENGRYEKTGSVQSLGFGPFNGSHVVAADFNEDGKTDILWAGDNDTYLGLNSTVTMDAIQFSSIAYLGSTPRLHQVSINRDAMKSGDFNGDGYADFVAARSYPYDNGRHYTLGLGSGSGTFTKLMPTSVQAMLGLWVVVGDLNNDGRDDFILSREGSGSSSGEVIRYMRNAANSGFDETVLFTSPSLAYSRVVMGDLNNDSKLDLVVQTSDQVVSLYLNRGDGVFAATPDATKALGIISSQIDVFDANGNNVPDLIAYDLSGVYYYPVSSFTDVENPTVSIVTPENGAHVSGNVALTALANDDIGIAGVRYYLGGTTAIGSERTASPYALTWNTTLVGDGSYALTAVAHDVAGKYATSTSVTVTVDNTPPEHVGDVTVSDLSARGARISWVTDEPTTGTLQYGLTSTYTDSAASGSLQGSHSVLLSGLTPNTEYHFSIELEDAAGNRTTIADTYFSTMAEEEAQEHAPSRRSGGSVQSRVRALTANGNVTGAGALKAQYPNLFGDGSLESLLATLAQLQAQLAALTGTPLPMQVRDLDLNDTGEDVRALQKILIDMNTGPAAAALKANGTSVLFGSLTRAALAEYQAKYGITPSVGYFGSKTRTEMSAAGRAGLWW